MAQKGKSKKHRSDLVFCGCQQCSYGLSSPDSYGKSMVRVARKKFRQQTRLILKEIAATGEDLHVPDRIAVGYTD